MEVFILAMSLVTIIVFFSLRTLFNINKFNIESKFSESKNSPILKEYAWKASVKLRFFDIFLESLVDSKIKFLWLLPLIVTFVLGKYVSDDILFLISVLVISSSVLIGSRTAYKLLKSKNVVGYVVNDDYVAINDGMLNKIYWNQISYFTLYDPRKNGFRINKNIGDRDIVALFLMPKGMREGEDSLRRDIELKSMGSIASDSSIIKHKWIPGSLVLYCNRDDYPVVCGVLSNKIAYKYY